MAEMMFNMLDARSRPQGKGAPPFKVGTYNGDGNATQAIVGVGFQPTFLIVYRLGLFPIDLARAHGMKTDQDGLNTHVNIKNTTSGNGEERYEADHVISLDADGFTVGDSTGSVYIPGFVFNFLNGKYIYVAFNATSTFSLASGTYTGDGNATQAIVGVGFRPKFLQIYGNALGIGSQPMFYRSDQDGADITMYYNGGVAGFFGEPDAVVSLDAGGFTVGDGTGSVFGNTANMLGKTYTYICWG